MVTANCSVLSVENNPSTIITALREVLNVRVVRNVSAFDEDTVEDENNNEKSRKTRICSELM